MKKGVAALPVCLVLAVCFAPQVSLAVPIGCLKCHGDDAAMKALVKPVLPTSAEGEG
jgi:hypothetical protein